MLGGSMMMTSYLDVDIEEVDDRLEELQFTFEAM